MDRCCGYRGHSWVLPWGLAPCSSGGWDVHLDGSYRPVEALQTMSVLVVAAPLAFFIGLMMGILSWKNKRVESVVQPILSVWHPTVFYLPAACGDLFKVNHGWRCCDNGGMRSRPRS